MRFQRLHVACPCVAGAAALSLILCIAGGCQQQPTTVSGSVMLDGRPLSVDAKSRGTVIFHPANGQGSMATGILDSAGNFSLATGGSREVAPGNYQVAVSVVRLLPKKEDVEQGTELITPAKYVTAHDSGLLAEVAPSIENHVQFNLVSNADDIAADSAELPIQSPEATDAVSPISETEIKE